MQYNFWSGKIITSGLALFCLANFSPALGQIVPDNTLPVNSQVTPGCTNCTIEGGTVRGNSLFHSFDGFSIPTGGQAYFNNADQIANIFSRVTGLSVSTIDGLIRANGVANLYLINPQGIVFGPNARIDVGGAFVASSASSLVFGNGLEFSATNPDAPPVLTVNLTPGLQYGGTNPGSTVQNEGVLAVKPGQDLTLTGETVLNSGTLMAPGGTIQVLGDYVGLLDNATLDVSSATGGGTVLIGGGFEEVRSQKSEVRSHQLLNAQETFIGPNVIINADGLGSSDGGKVAVWSEKNTDFQGTITARGGILGGNGGFIETSAKDNLTITGTVNASAINGNAGTWLIDPTNITITGSGGGNIGDSTVNVANINSALDNGTNVEITTNIGGTDEGNITQESSAAINWSSGSSLTLNADNDITLNSSIISRNGGNITLDAGGNITLNGAFIGAATSGEGDGGGIKIDTGSLFLTDFATITTRTLGQGNAGTIELTAIDTISLSGSFIFSQVESGARGNAGEIKIDTGSLSLTDGALLLANTVGQGNAGAIEITATDTISLSDSDITSQVLEGARGNSGGIKIDTGSLFLTDGAQISANTAGQGNAGAIEITATDTISLSGVDTQTRIVAIGSQVDSRAIGNSEGIKIITGSLSLTDGAQLSTATNGKGNAGVIEITATETISLSGQDSQEFVSAIASNNGDKEARGNAGEIKITTGSLSLTDGAQISASTKGQGNAGVIEIMARDSISLSGESSQEFVVSGIFSQVDSGARGNAGEIKITTGSLSLTDGAFISADTKGQGDAGAIEITATETISLSGQDSQGLGSQIFSQVDSRAIGNSEGIKITTDSLSLTDGGLISTRTTGQGIAGNINITASTLEANQGSQILTDTITDFDAGDINLILSNHLTLTGDETGLFAQTEGSGQAGDITLKVPQLTLSDAAQISATNISSESGNITLRGLNTIEVKDGSQITASTETGTAGNLTINENETPVSSVQISGANSRLAAEATGEGGNAGGVTINARQLTVSDGATVSAENVSAQEGGSVNLQGLNTLNVLNGGEITTSTKTGKAGDVSINQDQDGVDSMQISGARSRLAAEATGEGGKAGDVTINAEQLTVADGATVSAQNVSAQEGGSINLQGLNTLNVLNGGQITASTETGTAGNLTINKDQTPVNSVQISGKDSILGVGATGEGDNVRAGDLTVNAGEMTITDGAAVTVSSPQGQAGNLTITTAQNLSLNEGSITAVTGQSGEEGGANIDLTVADLLFLANQSEISANARADANGGNVDINARFVIASFPAIHDGSDISANAQRGDGGEITITADGIFGIEFREEQTPLSDITATSESGDDGIVTFDIPNTDPSRSVTELAQPVDPSNEIVRACVPTEEGDSSEFTVTGRGGLPASPSDVLSRDTVVEDLGTLATSPQTSDQTEISNPAAPPSAPLVEADGWILAKNGDIIFISKAASESPQPHWQPSLNCPTADHPH